MALRDICYAVTPLAIRKRRALRRTSETLNVTGHATRYAVLTRSRETILRFLKDEHGRLFDSLVAFLANHIGSTLSLMSHRKGCGVPLNQVPSGGWRR